MKTVKWSTVLLAVCCCFVGSVRAGWKKDLSKELPLLGHRNWIVVVDFAYPLQIAQGIETVYAGGDHIDVLRTVLDLIAWQKHIRTVIYTDEELNYIDETNASGIGTLRGQLNAALAGADVQTFLHEEIIHQLDKAGETFRIILIKTDLTLPYTSVFIRLGCGYWCAKAEQELRNRMETE